MVYVLVGLFTVFLGFVIWALVKGNSFSVKKEEKHNVVLPPKEEDFVPIVEQKPKKVKIKKKAEKVSGDSQVVKVFEGEEKTLEKTNDSAEREKDAVYQKYISQKDFKERFGVGENDNLDACEGSRFERPQALSERDVERRAHELKRSSFESASAQMSKNSESAYYGFGVGAEGRTHGSMRDPNFNPWPDEDIEKNSLYGGKIDRFIDDDDDILDMAAIDRLMAERPRKSGLGGGSIKNELADARRGLSAKDIAIAQAIASRRTGNNPFGDDSNGGRL